jgi:hypothetical protein
MVLLPWFTFANFPLGFLDRFFGHTCIFIRTSGKHIINAGNLTDALYRLRLVRSIQEAWFLISL